MSQHSDEYSDDEPKQKSKGKTAKRYESDDDYVLEPTIRAKYAKKSESDEDDVPKKPIAKKPDSDTDEPAEYISDDGDYPETNIPVAKTNNWVPSLHFLSTQAVINIYAYVEDISYECNMFNLMNGLADIEHAQKMLSYAGKLKLLPEDIKTHVQTLECHTKSAGFGNKTHFLQMVCNMAYSVFVCADNSNSHEHIINALVQLYSKDITLQDMLGYPCVAGWAFFVNDNRCSDLLNLLDSETAQWDNGKQKIYNDDEFPTFRMKHNYFSVPYAFFALCGGHVELADQLFDRFGGAEWSRLKKSIWVIVMHVMQAHECGWDFRWIYWMFRQKC